MGNQSKYDETLEGEALRAAVVKFVDNIISQVNKKSWSCLVAAVKNGSVYLNAGQESGLQVGQKLEAFSQGEEIIDPSSGIVLGREEERIGTLKIASYFGDNGAIAHVISGSTPKPKDLCRLAE